MTATVSNTTSTLVEKIRADFPALRQEVNGRSLVYLDNGATTQKPQCVLDSLAYYYQNDNSNVHRGAHTLSDRATQSYESARDIVQQFINASSRNEIVWTRGTTEAINLVASTWGRQNIKAGDQILISAMEHHSNIVPWQLLCEQTGAELCPIPVDDSGVLDLNAYQQMLGSGKVKLVSIVHVSNSLGTVNPVATMIEAAHQIGARVLVDGAQSVGHWSIDVQQLDADFYVFSGHKLFGPTGIGVLYGKEALLNDMTPYQGGGEMIERVSFGGTTFNKLPYKFEAGTPNIAGAIGLASAIGYLNELDRQQLLAHEQDLLTYCQQQAKDLGGIREIGQAPGKASVFSFLLDGAHPADVGTLLDQQGIAVRTGHHCTMPIFEQYQIPGTVRASISFYNTRDDIDRLFQGLEKAKMFLL